MTSVILAKNWRGRGGEGGVGTCQMSALVGVSPALHQKLKYQTDEGCGGFAKKGGGGGDNTGRLPAPATSRLKSDQYTFPITG